MLEKETAEAFAKEWIESWNSHDLERILDHYSEEFELSSTYIIKIAGDPSGILKGKTAVREYWAKALALKPTLHFRLAFVLWGINSLVIHYDRDDGSVASEWFEFGADGKVIRSCAHYAL